MAIHARSARLLLLLAVNGLIGLYTLTATFGRQEVERTLAAEHPGVSCESTALLPFLIRVHGWRSHHVHGRTILWLPGLSFELRRYDFIVCF